MLTFWDDWHDITFSDVSSRAKSLLCLTLWHDITESDVFLMLAKLSYGKSGKQEQGKNLFQLFMIFTFNIPFNKIKQEDKKKFFFIVC